MSKKFATVSRLGYHGPMKRPPNANYKKKSSLNLGSGWPLSKRWRIILTLAIVCMGIVLIYKYVSYTHRFSDKDYAAIEHAAQVIFDKLGAKDTQKYKECSYEAPEKYSSVHLYCSIEMATYLPYENDQQAIAVGKSLEREIKNLGQPLFDMNDYYDNIADAYTTLTVNLQKPLPEEQCNFTIGTGDRASKVANSIKPAPQGRLIGISFDCSAQSREEYFPVTYRQGE